MGDVLRRRVEGQQFVEIPMVEIAVDVFFYFGEVAHHPIGIQFFRAAIYGDEPIVSVPFAAGAFVVERQSVATRYFQFLFDVVHSCSDEIDCKDSVFAGI